MTDLVGKTILHYRIIKQIGQGGMGIVYLAKDTKLERQVAIKFLPHQIAVDEEQRARFEMEAKAAAALNHPNIATIHAIEEVNNELFIVMEYIPGKELKSHINSSPLPIEKTIDIAAQIAEGLKAAHNKKIIHRDIKSSNIMITDEGIVKIMDFGLAKIRGDVPFTKEQSTLGTVAYMSPEQTRGEDVDHRSDIWSFGVVLYEMICGQLPFKGDYDQAIIYSILNEEPENISQLRQDVPEFLEPIVKTAMAKRLEERYLEMAVILDDLQNGEAARSGETKAASVDIQKEKPRIWQKNTLIYSTLAAILLIVVVGVFWISFFEKKNTPNSAIKRIAVLPLENLGPIEQEYFADGLTGEITGKLSGISGLAVIARSSAMQYKKTTKSLQQIADELKVDYVLEGTLQWAENAQGGKRIRVNPELIKIDDDTQVWSKPYEAEFDNAFKLQADIAATVAEALNINLVDSEQQALTGELTNNPNAYDIYLRAMEYSTIITDEKKLRIAEQLFQKAIALDSNFAAAYSRLSTVQSDMYWQYYERTEDNLVQSKTNAERALSLDPNLPEAHVAMGNYYYHGKLDYEPALQEYNEAIRLQPNNADAYSGIGAVQRRQDKVQQAVISFKKVYEIDPRSFQSAFEIGLTYLLLREYEQAIQMIDRAISLKPDVVEAYFFKAKTYLLKGGAIKEARAVIESALRRKIGEGIPQFIYSLASCNILEGNFAGALKDLSGIEKMENQFIYKPEDLLVAQIYRFMKKESLARKKYNSALQILERKIAEHPEDSRLYSALGLTYAGLGRKTDAIREGKRGIELLPISKEAWRGSYRLLDLAQIYAMVGKQELSLDAIEELLEKSTDALSIWLLKHDPSWDSLRENPRFQKLLEQNI